MPCERIDRSVHRLAVALHRLEFRAQDTPAQLGPVLADIDEAQEELSGRLLPGVMTPRGEEMLGRSGECTADPTELVICVERQRRSFAAFEQFAECVLKERK